MAENVLNFLNLLGLKKQINKQTSKQTSKQTCKQTSKQTNKQTNLCNSDHRNPGLKAGRRPADWF